jgi:hypothetical protein
VSQHTLLGAVCAAEQKWQVDFRKSESYVVKIGLACCAAFQDSEANQVNHVKLRLEGSDHSRAYAQSACYQEGVERYDTFQAAAASFEMPGAP